MRRFVPGVLVIAILLATAPIAWTAGQRQISAGTTIVSSIGPYASSYGHFSIRSTKPSTVVVETNINWPPGDQANWHYHPGPTYVIVQSGTLTFYRHTAHGCARTDYHAGQTAFEPAGQIHNVINRTKKTVKAAIVQLGISAGSSYVIPATQPANCPSV